MVKITYLGHLPPEDPEFSGGVQIFTVPYSDVSPDSPIDKADAETPEPEDALAQLELLEPDWETAEANFDKLMDAYELGGTVALREKFLELCKKTKEVS